ncbi:MAG: methyltransferase domain-containing protein [Acidobacteria bacterium]|nr:methyltransferase domain-containing protein [Acidobacteriota bacterium]
MTRKEDSLLLGSQQLPNNEPPANLLPSKQKGVIIDTWLSQFEQQIAKDFQRRTGLDYKTTIAQIIEAAEPFPGMRVLDVPTGTGVLARQFVGKVGQDGKIIGVDETSEKVEQARLAAQSAKASSKTEWRMMPICKLKFDNDSFDLVTSGMAFHRLDGEQYLAEIYRVLAPGGRLLIADEFAPAIGPSPLLQSVRRSYYRFIARDTAEAEARFHTTEEMMRMMRETGFSQIVFRALRQRSKYDRVFTLIKAVK